MSEEGNKIVGHSYDGIEELDHSLPRWWLLTFYGTILFSALYFVYYSMGDGPTLFQEYNREKVALEVAQAKNTSGGGPADETKLLATIKNPEKQKHGKEVYQTRCASCHGAEGQGGIGPNLTDDYWIHGNKPSQIVATIVNGVGDKGMPPWGPLLSEDDIFSLTAYIKSIHGTNPAGAKAPQGELIKE